MEERASIIEVGDEILNSIEDVIAVTQVDKGNHGLVVRGVFDDGDSYAAFWPYELPPLGDDILGWHGWANRCTITLANGRKVGELGVYARVGEPDTVEEYDAKWLETQPAMKAEEGAMQSRPTDIRLN